MKRAIIYWRHSAVYTAIALSLPISSALAQITLSAADTTSLPSTFAWSTVANSETLIPNGAGKTFNSFNQPSVNSTGLVALRARSKGGNGQPLRGIYSRQMGGVAGSLKVVFDTQTEVPQPNNTLYSSKLSSFTEFPAFPRIGLTNKTIISRGQSNPVWTYTLADGTETRTGTSGVYAFRSGERVSAMTQLGAAPGFEYFTVPGAVSGTKFDQFPGAPAVGNLNTTVFKGNYTDAGISKTGIFFRTFNADALTAKTKVIASSNTLIPGQKVTRFGSTAPPSASGSDVVFLGLDIEEAPTMGGIYRAPLATNPTLKPLVTIGGQVPGEAVGVTFTRLGEGLSYDGRYVAFWGGWSTEERTVNLKCPVDGQAAVIAFCNTTYPNGHDVQVLTHQGIFVFDTESRKTYVAAKTGADYLDFLYWTFSGRPPGVGDADSEDFEDPRWRSASFAATFTQNSKAQVAFKGRKQSMTDGIYLTVAPASPQIIRTVIETGMDGARLDTRAAGIPVTAIGIERDGLRNGWLAIAASMANEVSSWAGVYLTRTAR
ncbi:hypothetical protein [Rhodoferax lacus]|uniref:hypothetical protein n=1 Tax=Rhodoferax lacus TaxID=2184758 RepID=UPI0011C0DFE1|nr:hypothetical protein [Rhodoferax lacus]